MKHIGLFFVFSVLLGCSNQVRLPSIQFDSCFTHYPTTQKLNNNLQRLLDSVKGVEKPEAEISAVIGCTYYQAGQAQQALQWLRRSYTSTRNQKTKSIAASAMGLIYLHEFTPEKITKELIMSAQNYHLGRWMLVLYYIDAYHSLRSTEHLMKAIETMKMKHRMEKGTKVTQLILTQMETLLRLESLCGGEEESPTVYGGAGSRDRSSAVRDEGENDFAQSSSSHDSASESCPLQLEETKRYILSWSFGYTAMLIKIKPFNDDLMNPEPPATPTPQGI